MPQEENHTIWLDFRTGNGGTIQWMEIGETARLLRRRLATTTPRGGQCMMAWFPYFDLDYVEIPDDVTATLCDSHKNYLLSELGLVVGTQVQTRCQNVRRIQVRRIENWFKVLCSAQTFNVLFMLNTGLFKSLLNHFENLGLFLTLTQGTAALSSL